MKGIISICLLLFSAFSSATEQAEQIFKQLAPALYQIKIIDKASGEKSSIGSGFQITEDGLMGTNYHVISSFARHPNKYQIEYYDSQGNSGPLTLERVDVINDLALVKRQVDQPMNYFVISASVPAKGEELFSLGNPHDLGMIVVPGTYNGLKKESFNDRIHFTGSVNPGMSGGPVVNQSSEVVGINVATSGNQIGFLVPHDKLKALLAEYQTAPEETIEQQIARQLGASQQKLISAIIDTPWQVRRLGEGYIPNVEVPFIRCWGESNADKPNALILQVVANCSLDENTYIANNFYTGALEMEFRYMQANKVSNTKFYYLYEQQIAKAGPGNVAGKEDVTEYQCQDDVVTTTNNGITNKAVFCTRAYIDFPELYDVLYIAGSIDKDNRALVSHFTVAGVKQDSAMALTKKFMEAVTWN